MKPKAAKRETSLTSINSMRLIHLVRSQEVLYNSAAEGYNDKNHKELIWERVTRVLVPAYDAASKVARDSIRSNVRRRWKTLRNAIAREVKKNCTMENYSRKKESPIIAELEFLIPHIKSSHCAKLSDEMGLRDSYSCVNDDNDFNEPIDLTSLEEAADVKPIIRSIAKTEPGKDSPHPNIFYPTLEMSTTDTIANSTRNWSNALCSISRYQNGEFLNSLTPSPARVNSDNTSKSSPESPQAYTPPPVAADAPKQPREAVNETQLQQHLLRELERRQRIDQEQQDEDRMFLLSLVSDLKRLSPAKKMFVKAEIVSFIAHASQ